VRITTQHARSSYGFPVILDDRGRVMDQIPGLTLALERLGWSRAALAEKCGVSPRTVEAWFQTVTVPPGREAPRRAVTAEALNVVRDALSLAGLTEDDE
jgi:AraC-like DNA-binding protein